MTVWLLFIWYTSGEPQPAGRSFLTEQQCVESGEHYKRSVCVKVFVPKVK
jgi:hypothetical protein